MISRLPKDTQLLDIDLKWLGSLLARSYVLRLIVISEAC
jgi:hypothetical protein